MYYHIGRMLIDENFDGGKDCPVCRIKNKVEYRLTEQYLGEGVMEDSTRTEVNHLGFCARHFDMLFEMRSKLGLALQSTTRLTTLKEGLHRPTALRNAKKQSEFLKKKTSSCVVCKYLNEHMIRYYKTIAEVYSGDPAFSDRLKAGNGFCFEHYADLLEYSKYAGLKAKNYLSDIYDAQIKRIEKTQEGLKEFCDHHDYRNASKPLGEGKNALPDTRNLFYGNK